MNYDLSVEQKLHNNILAVLFLLLDENTGYTVAKKQHISFGIPKISFYKGKIRTE